MNDNIEGAQMDNNKIGIFYRFRDFYIPKRMDGAIRRYIDKGIIPGSFLSAVISNDLRAACEWADEVNLKNLPAYIGYFYNESPSLCWGSAKIMKRWVKRFNKASSENR